MAKGNRSQKKEVKKPKLGLQTPGIQIPFASLKSDAEIKLEEITPAFIQSLARLEPHGIGNPAPLFLLRDVPLRSIQVLKEKHLKLHVGTLKKNLEAVWWQAAQHQIALSQASDVSLLCRPEVNEWKGRSTLQLKVVGVAI